MILLTGIFVLLQHFYSYLLLSCRTLSWFYALQNSFLVPRLFSQCNNFYVYSLRYMYYIYNKTITLLLCKENKPKHNYCYFLIDNRFLEPAFLDIVPDPCPDPCSASLKLIFRNHTSFSR